MKSFAVHPSVDFGASVLPDETPICFHCDKSITGEVFHSDDDMGEEFCSEACVEKYDDNRNEAKYASICEAR